MRKTRKTRKTTYTPFRYRGNMVKWKSNDWHARRQASRVAWAQAKKERNRLKERHG